MRSLYIIAYFIVAVAVGAIGAGLNMSGVQTWGHLFGAVEIGLLISGAFVFRLTRVHWLAFLFAYACWRIAGFDYIINLTSGQSLFYVGGHNWWDMFFVKFPAHGVTFMRCVFLLVGISIPFKYLR